jgi:hypothetical protein
MVIRFETKLDRLADTLGQLVESARLGMTTPQSRHRGDIKTPGVTLDDHVEFADFAIFRHAQSLLHGPSPVNRLKAGEEG